MTRVVLAAAHLDNDPANNRLVNLKSLCQRCHMLHDRPYHLAQRWLTYRRRWAIGDLFFGRYGIQPPSPALFVTAFRAKGSPGRARSRAYSGWLSGPAGGRTDLGSANDLFAIPR